MPPDAFFSKLSAKEADNLRRAGFFSAMDILLHFPRRYEDWLHPVPVAKLKNGETALVEGTLSYVRIIPMRNGRRHLLASLKDAAGDAVILRFFHSPPGLRNSLYAGRQLRARGVVRLLRRSREMAHPKLQSQNVDAEMAAVYPAAKPLMPLQIRKLVARALATADLSPTAPPCDAFDGGEWELKDALHAAHLPGAGSGAESGAESNAEPLPKNHPAWRRLCYEELLAHQILLRRRYYRRGDNAPALNPAGDWSEPFYKNLPFTFTAAQQRAAAEILSDIGKARPMRRLLQGDVGSGKTAVAALACLCAAKAGRVAALMAPTEILAEQHHRTLSALLAPARAHCELITGAVRGENRRAALRRLQFGISPVVVGTHTLFQESVPLPRLALAIIDEQHRFGVEQRRALVQKSGGAHQLMMSATPIPRTLSMGVFADMDISILDEKPANRRGVQTAVLDGSRRAEVLARLASHIAAGGRAYWVSPLVEDGGGEANDVQSLAAEVRAAHPQVGVGILHGRMKAAEKNAVMEDFREGKIGLLAATTVVEVGVDVPQADVMAIERADLLGLSQLHQLRGRVGRGEAGGHCLLMYRPPLSDEARARLEVIRNSDDGFEIARQDLLQRGPGALLGSRQSGLPELRVAELMDTPDILNAARKTAEEMLQNNKRGCIKHIRRWFGGRAAAAAAAAS